MLQRVNVSNFGNVEVLYDGDQLRSVEVDPFNE